MINIVLMIEFLQKNLDSYMICIMRDYWMYCVPFTCQTMVEQTVRQEERRIMEEEVQWLLSMSNKKLKCLKSNSYTKNKIGILSCNLPFICSKM